MTTVTFCSPWIKFVIKLMWLRYVTLIVMWSISLSSFISRFDYLIQILAIYLLHVITLSRLVVILMLELLIQSSVFKRYLLGHVTDQILHVRIVGILTLLHGVFFFFQVITTIVLFEELIFWALVLAIAEATVTFISLYTLIEANTLTWVLLKGSLSISFLIHWKLIVYMNLVFMWLSISLWSLMLFRLLRHLSFIRMWLSETRCSHTHLKMLFMSWRRHSTCLIQHLVLCVLLPHRWSHQSFWIKLSILRNWAHLMLLLWFFCN